MQVIPRRDLPLALRSAGLNAHTREFPNAEENYRVTVSEAVPAVFRHGPHRKARCGDGHVEGRFPVADRPALSCFVPAAFHSAGATAVIATVPDGALWLNNRAQAAYLRRVADAQRVCRFLRRRGLTDRFKGGFRVTRPQFSALLPTLAANPFAGGADVLFAAIDPPGCRLTVLACHHFDLHLCSPDRDLTECLAALAARHALAVTALALPDVPDEATIWR